MTHEPTVKRLESGYWLVWWGPNRWIQSFGYPRREDGFGWLTPADFMAADKAINAAEERLVAACVESERAK